MNTMTITEPGEVTTLEVVCDGWDEMCRTDRIEDAVEYLSGEITVLRDQKMDWLFGGGHRVSRTEGDNPKNWKEVWDVKINHADGTGDSHIMRMSLSVRKLTVEEQVALELMEE